METRVGTGYDVHRLERETSFWVGGVQIPHEKGALGFSDGDVLIHAVIDALLGAASFGDIGYHFPPGDAAYKDVDSKVLLSRTADMLKEAHYRVGNVDAVVALQAPKLGPYIPEMRKVMADVLGLTEERALSVKATTTERLGFIGREEGVAAHAIALIHRDTPDEEG